MKPKNRFSRQVMTFCAFFYQNKAIDFREKTYFSFILHNLFCHLMLMHGHMKYSPSTAEDWNFSKMKSIIWKQCRLTLIRGWSPGLLSHSTLHLGDRQVPCHSTLSWPIPSIPSRAYFSSSSFMPTDSPGIKGRMRQTPPDQTNHL